MSTLDQPHSKYRHVYVIVRVELDFDREHPDNSVSVTRVFDKEEDAASEIVRMNKLNGSKGYRYLVCVGRADGHASR
jgi:hypothetical protein